MLSSLQRTIAAQHNSTFASLQRTIAAQHNSTFASLQRTIAAQHNSMFASLQQTIGEVERSHKQLASFQQTIGELTRSHEQITSHYQTVMRTAQTSHLNKLRWTVTQATQLPNLTSLQNQIAGLSRIPTFTPIIRPNIFETPAWILEADRLENTGWFPHSTFPRHLLERNVDDSSLDELVLSYYRDNWASIRQIIEDELSKCDVERDTKETLREALHAHEQGLYRLVPSSLFSVIERAVRVHLCANRFGSISVNELLGDRIGNLPMSMLPYGSFGYVGYTQLSRHLYENIHNETTRKRFVAASVPNRHATIHGLVIYSSEKSSLNAIFVAMYVFRALTVLTSGVPRRS